METIVAEGLTKNYGKAVAVDNVSFKVAEGEVFGFLGPNGAGKTTTIKMLNTLTKIGGGRASVAGFDVGRQGKEVRKAVGLVPQDMTLDRDMTGRQNLKIQSTLYDVPSEVAARKSSELLELVDLKSVAEKEVGTYSWGMQRRLAIAMGLVHTPRILFLDEPTLGLDVQSRLLVWDYIKRLKQEFKMTIFLTTHYLEEADDLSDRIAIINKGRIQVEGTPGQLKMASGGDVVTFVLADKIPEDQLKAALSTIRGMTGFAQEGYSLIVHATNGDEVLPQVVSALSNKGVGVKSVDWQRRTLNEVFTEFVGKSLSSSEQDQDANLMSRMRLLRETRN